MPTAGGFRGRGVTFLIKKEATYGVAPAGNWLATYILSDRLGERRRFGDDQLLGVPRNNDYDLSDPAPTLRRLDGDIEVPLDLNHFGYWLAATFGDPTTTGTTNKTHAYAVSPATFPSFGVEGSRSIRFQRSLGCVVRSIRIPLGRSEGYRRATIGIVGREQTRENATSGGVPVAAIALSQLSGAFGRLQLDAVDAGSIMEGEFLYERTTVEDRYVGDTDKVSDVLVEGHRWAVTGRVRFNTDSNTAWYQWGHTPTVTKAVNVILETGVNNSLQFSLPVVRCEQAPVDITGPGFTEFAFTLRAEQTTSAAAATVTLKNQIVSYAL